MDLGLFSNDSLFYFVDTIVLIVFAFFSPLFILKDIISFEKKNMAFDIFKVTLVMFHQQESKIQLMISYLILIKDHLSHTKQTKIVFHKQVQNLLFV